MKHALLLFLSSNHLQARWLENGKTIAEGDFPDSADGKANFSTFLKGKKCATYLLVDVIEEDFRQETIPHLIGGTRNALLKRKFEQFYRDTPFQQATFLQRQSNGRRDDEMLFSALTNPSAITPWVDIMLTYKTPLIGIYSVPQVSTPLVKNHISKHLLLISWERSAGLRQSYFRDHRLNISRLTPLRGETTFQDAVLDELGRTYQYLKNLSLLPAGQTLDVRIMGAVNDLVELQQKLPRSADMRYDFADLEDIAKQLKFNDTVTDSDASLLFMHQLLATPPKSSYANSSHTHFYDLWKLRRGMNWTSIGILVASLISGASDVAVGELDKEQARTLRMQAQTLQGQTQQVLATMPSSHAPATDMKMAVYIMRTLDDRSDIPEHLLHPLSEVLNKHLTISILTLTWQYDANEPVAENTREDFPALIFTIKGQLNGFGTRYRAALDELEQFERDLLARGYIVTITEKPLDISATGSIGDRRESDGKPLAFSMRLAWRPKT